MSLSTVAENDDVHVPMPPVPSLTSAPPPARSAGAALSDGQGIESRLYRVSQMIREPTSPTQAGPSLSRPSQSWHRAGRLIKQSLGFRDNANVVFDTNLPLQQRVDALQQLERRLAIDPSRQYLAAALRKRQDGRYANFGDKILTEVYITSETVFDWLTPPPHEHHVILTPLICLICIVAFAYMSGSFLTYAEHVKEVTCATPAVLYSPTGIGRWITGDFRRSWCIPGNAWQFDQGFLALWGGRYTPMLRGRWYTLVLSAFVHRSFLHVASNLVLILMVGREIERRYGQLRFLLLWLNAVVGANLFSAVGEHNCDVVCGLSGGIFGLIALYCLDIWNTRSKRQVLILRVAGLVSALLGLFLGFIVTPQGFSHQSHIGGVIFGVLPAFLFQEHLTQNERIEAWLPAVSATILTLLYTILFGVFYGHTITHVTCGDLI